MRLTKLLQKDYTKNSDGYQLKLPLNLETIIPDNDSVRLLSQFVEAMDLTDLYSTYKRINSVSPRILLKIVLYSYRWYFSCLGGFCFQEMVEQEIKANVKAGFSYVEYNMQSKKRTIKNLVYSKTYFGENMKFVWIVKNIRVFYGHWHFLTLGKNSLTFMMGGWKYLSYSQVFLRPLVRWRKLNHVYKHRCRYWHTQINYVTVLYGKRKHISTYQIGTLYGIIQTVLLKWGIHGRFIKSLFQIHRRIF